MVEPKLDVKSLSLVAAEEEEVLIILDLTAEAAVAAAEMLGDLLCLLVLELIILL